MRFMVMHKQMAELDESTPIDPVLLRDMGALIQGSLKEGIFVTGAGLKVSKYRTRLSFRGGECVSTQPGPYTGVSEHLASFSLIKVKTKEEALELARRFGRHLGDAELELGQVTEPWDLGMMPRPDNAPIQFLLLHKADPKTESGNPPTDQELKSLSAMMGEWAKAGVLPPVSSNALQRVLPSSQASRLQFKGGKRRTVIDGPFTESKELIGGFSILELPSREAALAWTERYGGILGDVEVDLLRLDEG